MTSVANNERPAFLILDNPVVMENPDGSVGLVVEPDSALFGPNTAVYRPLQETVNINRTCNCWKVAYFGCAGVSAGGIAVATTLVTGLPSVGVLAGVIAGGTLTLYLIRRLYPL